MVEEGEIKKSNMKIMRSKANLLLSIFTVFLFLSAAFAGNNGNEEEEIIKRSGLVMNYYDDTCPQAEDIIKQQVKLLYKRHKNTAFSWLRNIFHDCAVEVIINYLFLFTFSIYC